MTTASLLLTLVLAAQSGSANGDAMRIAVLPLSGPAPEAVRLELEGLVRAEVTRLADGAEVLDGDATREEFGAAQMMGLNCAAADTPCIARTAIVMQVGRVLTGTVELVGDAAKVVLYLVEASTGVRLNEVEQLVPTSGPARLSIAREAVTLLIAPERILGSLRLIVAPAGALIILDGEPVGTAPMASPLTGVRAGQHAVRVELDGYASASEQVEVTAGSEAMIDIALRESGIAGADPPDEDLGLVDDAPSGVSQGGGGFSVPLMVGGGIVAALGGAAVIGAGGAALVIDYLLVYTSYGDFSLRTALFLGEIGLVVGVVIAGLLCVAGLSSAGLGGIVLLTE